MPQDLAGQRLHFVDAARELHAAALAAAAGVDLRLDHPDRAANSAPLHRFEHGEGRVAPRHRHAVRAAVHPGIRGSSCGLLARGRRKARIWHAAAQQSAAGRPEVQASSRPRTTRVIDFAAETARSKSARHGARAPRRPSPARRYLRFHTSRARSSSVAAACSRVLATSSISSFACSTCFRRRLPSAGPPC